MRDEPSLLKATALVVSVLGLAVGSLQLAHDLFGFKVSPIDAAREAIEPVWAGNSSGTDADPGEDDPEVPGPDDSPPTAPQDLRLVSQSGCDASLAWDPSDDDVEVRSYRVYEDGQFASMVEGSTTSVTVLLFPGREHSYTVVASDGPNESEPSNAVTVPVCELVIG